MRHPHARQQIAEERYRDLLKEAELNGMLRRAGSRPQERFGLVRFLAGKMDKLLISAKELNHRPVRNAANHYRPSPTHF